MKMAASHTDPVARKKPLRAWPIIVGVALVVHWPTLLTALRRPLWGSLYGGLKKTMDAMVASKAQLTLYRSALVTKLLLLWYITFFLAMAISPVDRKTWLAANVLPVFFVATLALSHKAFPLSNQSYLLITVWLTLHTVAVHYTYPKVPLGFWLEHWLNFHRNHFDRVVHFSFGFLLAYPLEEIFRRVGKVTGWLLPYLVVMTILGFSAFWEIIEAWVGQVAHPDLEMAFVGHQGDVWDPQRDIAAALYGAILCVAFLAMLRWLREPISAVETASAAPEALGDL